MNRQHQHDHRNRRRVTREKSLGELLAASGVVSIHCPLTPETRGIINGATLRQMRKGAILVKTARGAIVDADAVLTAPSDGTLGGAGLDVRPGEPPPPGDVLTGAHVGRFDGLTGDRLIITPHAAGSSPENVADARRLSVETAMLFLREGKLRNLVNIPVRAA